MSANNSPDPSNGSVSRKERRAAERAARKSGSSKPSSSASGGRSGPSMLVISLGALAIGLVAVVALVLISGGLGNSDDAAVSEPDIAAPAAELRQGRTLVAPGAVSPVVVEAFEDPQCVHCATFTERVEPLLVAGPVTDGTASFTYRDFIIFGGESFDAAVAMRAAEALDGKFWDYHKVLFHNQDGVENGSFSRDRLADMAVLVGLDREAFLEQLDDPALREAVAADGEEGVALGIASTPTIIVDGQVLTAPSWEELKAAIEEAAAAG